MRGADDLHRLEIVDTERWAATAARLLAERITAVIARRGRCLIALSGGGTPGPVFAELAKADVDWTRVVALQADERLVPVDSPDRNLRAQQDAFAGLPIAWLPLPVDDVLDEGLPDGDDALLRPIAEHSPAVAAYIDQLHELADSPARVDLVHLGLGDDGHTASLFPDDPALFELRWPVALTDERNGHRRLTLTRSVIDRSGAVFWLVRGSSKAKPLGRLLAGDLTIPAGLIRPAHSVVLADTEAARQM